jgi:hypothetical protein
MYIMLLCFKAQPNLERPHTFAKLDSIEDWKEHVERMILKPLSWQAYYYNPTGRRDLTLIKKEMEQFI